jgi:hypothetical protein
MILKNDYMNCKDYNLMKSLSKCVYNYEFCAILICFIGHKVYIKEWTVRCVQGVTILKVFYLYKTKPLILKSCG